MKTKKIITAAICIAVISALVVSVAAAVIHRFSTAEAKEELLVVNRVNIVVSQTEFTYTGVQSDGMLHCTTTVSIEKTEPDFYGFLHSITLYGAEFGYTMYTADKDNGEAVLPQDAVLPADENGTHPLEWDITFTVPYEENKDEYTIDLVIDYTTGLKPSTTQRYQTTIPLTLTVEQ